MKCESRGRILVIEPDTGVRDAIAAWLERAGFQVVAARDADAARAILPDAPSLLLCEIPVPGRESLEFLRDLRKLQPELPTILMTTGGREALCQEARRLGFTTWLIKPFQADVLETLVACLLGGHRLEDPKGLGKRQEPRFPVFLPVTCRPLGGREVSGTSRNLSAGGAMVILPYRLPERQGLAIKLHTRQGPIALQGEVVWVTAPAPRSTNNSHGLRFTEHQPPDFAATLFLQQHA